MKKTFLPGDIALKRGNWVKLICGASNQDLPAIADLCSVYSVAGVHCIDVGADIAVINAAQKGLELVKSVLKNRPWLMVSVSDGPDMHFRKAYFDPNHCPSSCPRPCEKSCPAEAINQTKGVIASRCYGCGRCIPSCPIGIIKETDYSLKISDLKSLITNAKPDAVEIHTAPGRAEAFESTVQSIVGSHVKLQRVGVSCGLEGHSINEQELVKELWQRHSCLRKYNQKPLWQLDGRPMSGDIGKGTARFAISLWKKICCISPPGPLQLAGGTNSQTINYLSNEIGPQGIAFGGVARKLIQPLLLEAQERKVQLIEWPEGWDEALRKAKELINPWLSRGSGFSNDE